MKNFVGILLFPAIFAISGCVVVPAGGDDWGAPPPPSPVMAEETVEVPVVYGEPCYYPPPIVVAYTYDYYTYENHGGYVNIVFWRNGRRYRSEPWYDHGRRMRFEHVQEWRRSHRIPVRQYEHHRESLERIHHISHPDSFYGRKPAIQQQRPQLRKPPELPTRQLQQQKPQMQQGAGQQPFQQQRPQTRQGPAQQQQPQIQTQQQQSRQKTGQQPFNKQQQLYKGPGQQPLQQQRLQTRQGPVQQQQQKHIEKPQSQEGSGKHPGAGSGRPHDREQQQNQQGYQQ